MSARSLSKFLRMFINNGSSLLNPRSIAEMKLVVGNGLIPHYGIDATLNSIGITPPNYGLGWYWQNLSDGRKYIGHSGSLPGARHWMLVNEENTLGVFILTNGDSNVPSGRAKEVYKTFEDIHLALFRCFEGNTVRSSACCNTVSFV